MKLICSLFALILATFGGFGAQVSGPVPYSRLTTNDFRIDAQGFVWLRLSPSITISNNVILVTTNMYVTNATIFINGTNVAVINPTDNYHAKRGGPTNLVDSTISDDGTTTTIHGTGQSIVEMGSDDGQITWLGGTNVITKNGADGLYTNGAAITRFGVQSPSGTAWIGMNAGAAQVTGGSTLQLLNLNANGLFLSDSSISPSVDGSLSLAGPVSSTWFYDAGLTHDLYIAGFRNGINYARLAVYHGGTNDAIHFDSQSSGTAGPARGFLFQTNGVTVGGIAAASGYDGSGTHFLSDDGTYKSTASVVDASLNPTVGTIPVRGPNTNFLDSPLTVSTTNVIASGPVLSTSATTNGPSADELATAGWVRNLLVTGSILYNSGDTNHSGFDNPTYAYNSGIPTNGSRTYLSAGLSAGSYFGSVMTTNTYSQISGDVVVQPYMVSSGGAASATYTVHAEIYYTYDKTNLLGDWESGVQTLIHGTATNKYSFAIPVPTTLSTNSTGFYIVRRLKVNSKVGTDDIKICYGTNTPSSISLPVPVGISRGNATAQVGLTAVNGTAGSYLSSDSAPALDQSIAPTWTGLHQYSKNVGALLSVGDTTFIDVQKASQTNDISGTLTIAHATNGLDGVEMTHVRWLFNASGSDQTLSIPAGWRTNVYSPVPTKITNGTITKMVLHCIGPTASLATQTNCYVSFEYFK